MPRLPKPGSDDGVWGDVLNDFLKVAHHTNGTLKGTAVSTAGNLRDGISNQTATVLQSCDLFGTMWDLQAGSAGYNSYATQIVGNSNGHLVVDGVGVSIGQRIAVGANTSYGPEPYNGIYVVTSTGSTSSQYVLDRAADANTDASMSKFIAVRILAGDTMTNKTVYYYPTELPVHLGTTFFASLVEDYGSHVEGQEALAMGRLSHAEGNAKGYGDFSHAEGSAIAEGELSHAEGVSHATGEFAHAENGATAVGDYSHAEGESNAWQDFMHSEGHFERQFSRVVCTANTNGEVTVPLSYGPQNHVIVFPEYYRAVILRARVLARRLDSPGTVSAWEAKCLIDGNNSNNHRIVGSPSFTLIAQDDAASTWAVSDITIDSDDHHCINVEVTGQAGNYIGWEATFELDEVRT